MPHYTCITETRQHRHLTQHEAQKPEEAVRLHVGALPYDDGTDPLDEELDWLQRVANGRAPVSLLQVVQCKNTWLWLEGARYTPQYGTYVVKTDIA